VKLTTHLYVVAGVRNACRGMWNEVDVASVKALSQNLLRETEEKHGKLRDENRISLFLVPIPHKYNHGSLLSQLSVI
jgi:hypothetical protein